ncbi:hypothetical protein RCC89_13915 [Cytophagaceae bacterium ABcell3]|nr:hypothetical protein RCC89_13915 [Cytophagaceae bacterium ABcell3]
MNKQTFTTLIRNPENISANLLKELEEVASTFPYSQAAHILIARAAHENHSMLAEKKLKKAAACTADRKNLKNIIQKKTNNLKVKEPTGLNRPRENSKPQNRIKNLQEEPFKEEVFREIEENLKKLHRLRKLADLHVPGPVIIVEEAPPPPTPETSYELPVSNDDTLPSLEELLPVTPKKAPKPAKEKKEQKAKEKHEPDASKKHYITSSRLDDELTLEEKNKLSDDAGLISDYLKFINTERVKKKKDKNVQNAIIDKFIKEDPTIPPLSSFKVNPNAPQEDLAGKTMKAKLPVSETFAKLMIKQGKTDKAINIYEELILKFPEKKAYFASQIENLKNT